MKLRLLLLSGALVLAACGQAPADTAAPAASTAAAPAASVAPAASAAGASSAAVSTDPAALKTGLDEMATAELGAIDSAIDTGDVAAAQAAFNEFDESWEAIEDGVKAVSPDSYKQIEEAIEAVEDAVVRTQTPTAADVKAATAELRTQLQQFTATLP